MLHKCTSIPSLGTRPSENQKEGLGEAGDEVY